jgi:hypothetical protein
MCYNDDVIFKFALAINTAFVHKGISNAHQKSFKAWVRVVNTSKYFCWYTWDYFSTALQGDFTSCSTCATSIEQYSSSTDC